MLRRNNDEFRIPLFLEERPLPRVPKYSKEVFREVYEPTPSDVEKGKSRLQKWMSALKKRLAGKKSDQLIQDKNFINGQTEPCSQCSLRERPGRSRGMIVERQRPVSMYDFRVTHQEKVLTLTPHSNTGTTYATVVAAPYTHSPTHVDRPHQPQQHYHSPGLSDADSVILPAVLVRLRRKGEAARAAAEHDGQAIRYRQHRRYTLYTDPDSDKRHQPLPDTSDTGVSHSYTCSSRRPYSCLYEHEPDVVVSAQSVRPLRTAVPVRPEWTNRVSCAPERQRYPPGTRKRFGGKRLLVLDDAALLAMQNGGEIPEVKTVGLTGMSRRGRNSRSSIMHEAIYEEVMI